MTTIYVYVTAADAVRAGVDRAGWHPVEIDLDRLGEDEREALAQIVEESDDGSLLLDREYAGPPTVETIRAAIEQERRQIEARRQQEEERRRKEEARAAAVADLRQRIAADPEARRRVIEWAAERYGWTDGRRSIRDYMWLVRSVRCVADVLGVDDPDVEWGAVSAIKVLDSDLLAEAQRIGDRLREQRQQEERRRKQEDADRAEAEERSAVQALIERASDDPALDYQMWQDHLLSKRELDAMRHRVLVEEVARALGDDMSVAGEPRHDDRIIVRLEACDRATYRVYRRLREMAWSDWIRDVEVDPVMIRYYVQAPDDDDADEDGMVMSESMYGVRVRARVYRPPHDSGMDEHLVLVGPKK